MGALCEPSLWASEFNLLLTLSWANNHLGCGIAQLGSAALHVALYQLQTQLDKWEGGSCFDQTEDTFHHKPCIKFWVEKYLRVQNIGFHDEKKVASVWCLGRDLFDFFACWMKTCVFLPKNKVSLESPGDFSCRGRWRWWWRQAVPGRQPSCASSRFPGTNLFLIIFFFVALTLRTIGLISWSLLSPNSLPSSQVSSCLTITTGITTSTLVITTSQKISFSGSSRPNLHGVLPPPLSSSVKPSSQRVRRSRLWLIRSTLPRRRRVDETTQRSRLKLKCPGRLNPLKFSFKCTIWICLQVAEATLSGVRPYYGGADRWQRHSLLSSRQVWYEILLQLMLTAQRWTRERCWGRIFQPRLPCWELQKAEKQDLHNKKGNWRAI